MHNITARILAYLVIAGSVPLLFFVGCKSENSSPSICREPTDDDVWRDTLIATPPPATDCGKNGSVVAGAATSTCPKTCPCTPPSAGKSCPFSGTIFTVCTATCPDGGSCTNSCDYSCNGNAIVASCQYQACS